MSERSSIFFLLLVVVATLPSTDVLAEEYRLYFLGGQSNMDGYGYVKQLPAELVREVEGVMIFHGNPAPDGVAPDGRGRWAPLRPGYGVKFRSDGTANQLSDRFGAELMFGRHLRKLDPNSKIAIITFCDAWHYDTTTFIDLGRQFAAAMSALEN